MSDQAQAMAASLVRSVHPEKVFDYLPGMTPANLAALYGLDEPGYRGLRDRYAAQTRRAAQGLLAEPLLSAAVSRLPFATGETVAVVGESTTDAADSWLEIVGHVLQQRPGKEVKVVNAAVSGYPTTMLQRVLSAVLLRYQPDWVVIFAGANDILRYGTAASKPLVHAAETEHNLAEMRRAAVAAGARVIWMTLTGIDIDKARAYPPFRHQQIWVDTADADAVDHAIRGQANDADLLIDLGAVLGQPPGTELLEPDGVHPSSAGHVAIARASIQQLAEQPRGC